MFKTLLEVRNRWLEVGPVAYPGHIDYYNPKKYPWQTNLRFDFEYPASVAYEDAIDDIMSKMLIEFMDIVYNGDVTQTHDAFLKSFDGANKRNAYPTLIDFRAVTLQRFYKETKDMYEYTVWAGP